jgi:hypothetical protein
MLGQVLGLVWSYMWVTDLVEVPVTAGTDTPAAEPERCPFKS